VIAPLLVRVVVVPFEMPEPPAPPVFAPPPPAPPEIVPLLVSAVIVPAFDTPVPPAPPATDVAATPFPPRMVPLS
jgi:hypothetical protein